MSTSIPYLDEHWSVVGGCSKCSPGCDHCWAEAVTRQRLAPQFPERYADLVGPDGWTGAVRCFEERLGQPARWRRPRVVGVGFMGDLFHEQVPDAFISQVFGAMEIHAQHTYLTLTKRHYTCGVLLDNYVLPHRLLALRMPHVWIGFTCCNQSEVDSLSCLLNSEPLWRHVFPHVWLSLEPLLEPVVLPAALLQRGGWVVAGSEAGAGRRSVGVDPFYALMRQCRDAHVPFYLKQWEVGNRVESIPVPKWAETPWGGQ